MEGGMTLSVLQKYHIPLKGTLQGKGIFKEKLKSCTVIKSLRPWTKDGVYTIYPDGKMPKEVYCDMSTENKGWTVFQRRIDGSVDFYRKWADYKSGFGNASGECWLGNDALHLLTRDGKCTLRIDLQTLGGKKAYSKFSNFTVISENDGYKMTFSASSGTGGDALSWHKGMKFTTKDKDNDRSIKNCANIRYGAWWYNNCVSSNLNGLYGQRAAKSMYWNGWNNQSEDRFMRKSKMMLQC